jgi:DNA polymerase-3 subunit gamma/tau
VVSLALRRPSIDRTLWGDWRLSYTVLARKYRSQTFDQVIGQEPIAATLKNAITSGRVAHGYLFAGTRGIGKTSMARILAKALNCLLADQPTTEPCGQCDLCEAVAEGQDIDVLEIDAASNTGVDNIRELRSNAAYRPARARFKVYIIDEVHMLSAGAFNALLKTLEEPPEHVKFIMATTEPQKLPATVLSRVQRFDFRLIPTDKIAEQLKHICKAEKVQAEEEALRRVARLANGSMRDALSLLDQLFSLGGKKISEALIDEILPSPHDETLAGLIDAWADHDAGRALSLLDRALSAGYSLEHCLQALTAQVHRLLLINTCGAESDLVDVPSAARQRLAEQAGRFDAPALVFVIAVLEDLRRQVRFSSTARALADAATVRLANLQNFAELSKLLGEMDAGGARPTSRRTAGPAAQKKTAEPAPAQPARATPRPKPVTQPPRPAPVKANVGGRALDETLRDPLVRKAMETFGASPLAIEEGDRTENSG